MFPRGGAWAPPAHPPPGGAAPFGSGTTTNPYSEGGGLENRRSPKGVGWTTAVLRWRTAVLQKRVNRGTAVILHLASAGWRRAGLV